MTTFPPMMTVRGTKAAVGFFLMPVTTQKKSDLINVPGVCVGMCGERETNNEKLTRSNKISNQRYSISDEAYLNALRST